MSPRYKTLLTKSRSVDMLNSCPPCVFRLRLAHCFAVQPRARASPRASVRLEEQAHNAKRSRTRSASTAFTTNRPPSGTHRSPARERRRSTCVSAVRPRACPCPLPNDLPLELRNRKREPAHRAAGVEVLRDRHEAHATLLTQGQ